METLAFILILIIFGYFSYPLILWFGFIGAYSLVFFDTSVLFWVVFALLAIVFLIPKNRLNLISTPLVKFIMKKGLLPKISQTEEAALQAGTNWVEADYFKADINFKAIKEEKVTKLTEEEKAFFR
jgi:acyl-CoA dehydrogenase